jgi:hypothetical protein
MELKAMSMKFAEKGARSRIAFISFRKKSMTISFSVNFFRKLQIENTDFVRIGYDKQKKILRFIFLEKEKDQTTDYKLYYTAKPSSGMRGVYAGFLNSQFGLDIEKLEGRYLSDKFIKCRNKNIIDIKI